MIPTKSVLPSKVTFRVQGVRTRVCLGCSPGLLVECVSLRLLPHGEQYRGSRSPPATAPALPNTRGWAVTLCTRTHLASADPARPAPKLIGHHDGKDVYGLG